MLFPVKTSDFVFGILYGISHETKLIKEAAAHGTEFCTGYMKKPRRYGRAFQSIAVIFSF
jgi:hypothetical protein